MGYFRKLLAHYQKFSQKPPKFFIVFAFILDFIKRLTNQGFQRNFVRFYRANIVPPESSLSLGSSCPKIELLFVSAPKDFPTLQLAVMSAISACAIHGDVQVSVIVPQNCLEECSALLPDSVNVISETEYLTESEVHLLKDRFGARYGWVLQQILKVRHVLKSKLPGVLVIDSDTILLKARHWLDNDGSQLLTPTWEYHCAYYKFLSYHGICAVNPQFTFVPHHMLMQPAILRESLSKANLLDEERLLHALINDSNREDNSPFCIEYELYAQYLISTYPNLVKLCKWSNLSVARESSCFINQPQEDIAKSYADYFSISLHDYL